MKTNFAVTCVQFGPLSMSQCMDTQWMEIGKIKGATGLPKYKELSEVMLAILLISHSNAECEQRSGLSNETLESLIILKT